MRATRMLVAAVAAASLVGVALIASPAAAATPRWTRTSGQTLNGYSWNGYKATVWPRGPRGWKIPKGSVSAGKSVTIARNGRIVASKRRSVRLSPGTYTAYSRFKYRSKTAYTTYRTHWMTTDYADSCTITSADITDSSGLYWYYDNSFSGEVTSTYSGNCYGSGYDSDYNERSGSWRATWTATEWISGDDPSAVQPEHPVGAKVTDSYNLPGGRFSYRTRHTAYRYGTVKTKYVYRTVTVKKVVNNRIMTRTEWHAIHEGDTLARVRKVVGSRGKLMYDGYLGTAYSWDNTSGGDTWVWFDGGRVESRTWYGY